MPESVSEPNRAKPCRAQPLLSGHILTALGIAPGLTVSAPAQVTEYSPGFVCVFNVVSHAYKNRIHFVFHTVFPSWFRNRDTTGLIRSWPHGGTYEGFAQLDLLLEVRDRIEEIRKIPAVLTTTSLSNLGFAWDLGFWSLGFGSWLHGLTYERPETPPMKRPVRCAIPV